MAEYKYFFEDARDVDGGKVDNVYLFDGLYIMKESDAYLSHTGQYPVISLSLKSGKQLVFQRALDSLIDEIQKEYKVAKSIREPEVKAKEAIEQIKDRDYGSELNDNGYEVVHKYGIVFFGRDCLVLYEDWYRDGIKIQKCAAVQPSAGRMICYKNISRDVSKMYQNVSKMNIYAFHPAFFVL